MKLKVAFRSFANAPLISCLHRILGKNVACNYIVLLFFSCLLHIQGFSPSGLKTVSCGRHVDDMFALYFYVCILIRYLIVCTNVPFLVFRVKFYSCFFIQYVFVLYVSLCVSLGWVLDRFSFGVN